MLLPTDENVELAFLPRALIAAMQTTMIRASMTAYSTAVGPSSRFRKLTIAFLNFRSIVVVLSSVETGQKKPTVLERNTRSAGGRIDLLADVAEVVRRVRAEGADRGDAHHDNQGQHDRVFDRRRAVFTLQEVDHCILEFTQHDSVPFVANCSRVMKNASCSLVTPPLACRY